MKILLGMIGVLSLAFVEILLEAIGEGLLTGVAYLIGRPFVWLFSFGRYRSLRFAEDEASAMISPAPYNPLPEGEGGGGAAG